nr:integrase, catalytic region, zinc finger, CCHC-type, peptidase aspartic, catalytic [Tanacetum cinerariifolium]
MVMASTSVSFDDYSRLTWVKFLASKDEALDFIIEFFKVIQVRLNAAVRNLHIDNGTEFINHTLRDYYEQKTRFILPSCFGALCYRNNDSENLGKLQAKADIGIFIGYAPKNKAYRIYNRRTKKIIEIIHVEFDELKVMASEQSSLEHALHQMTRARPSSGLVPNPSPSALFVLPSMKE